MMQAKIATRRRMVGLDAVTADFVYEEDGDFDMPPVYGDQDWGVAFKCTVENPPSSEGRSLYVRIQPEMAALVMKELRSFLIRQRRQGLVEVRE